MKYRVSAHVPYGPQFTSYRAPTQTAALKIAIDKVRTKEYPYHAKIIIEPES